VYQATRRVHEFGATIEMKLIHSNKLIGKDKKEKEKKREGRKENFGQSTDMFCLVY